MPPKFTINPNIAQAETLPAEFYQNPEIFIDCKEKIFAPSWQFITHSSTFNDHTIFPFSFLKGYINEPLLLIKNGENINCYSNEGNTWKKSDIKFINENELTILLREKFKSERGRINCSLWAEKNRWRWLGIQYVIAEY